VKAYFVKEQRRSQRFQLTMPMTLLRGSRGDINKIGETRNVSSSGVYFVVAEAIELGTLVEFLITLPEEVTAVAAAKPVRLLCKGKITRVERQEDALVGVAATIERYEFLRESLN
jgi:hypothetical protein